MGWGSSVVRAARSGWNASAGWQLPLRWCVVGLAYYLGARLGLLIPYVGTQVSLIWLPTGMALAAYLRWGGAMAPAIALAAFQANRDIGGPVAVAAGIALGNALGPWVSAQLLRLWHFDARLVRRRDLGVFLLAVGAGMVVTATNGLSWLLSGAGLCGLLAFSGGPVADSPPSWRCGATSPRRPAAACSSGCWRPNCSPAAASSKPCSSMPTWACSSSTAMAGCWP